MVALLMETLGLDVNEFPMYESNYEPALVAQETTPMHLEYYFFQLRTCSPPHKTIHS